jgi:hypothetical protein
MAQIDLDAGCGFAVGDSPQLFQKQGLKLSPRYRDLLGRHGSPFQQFHSAVKAE